MKQLLLLAIWPVSFAASGQPTPKLKKPDAMQSALNEVVQEFFNNFDASTGDVITEAVGVTSYESLVTLPGAVSATINKYLVPVAWSWEARMQEADDYQSAAKQYNQIFRQLHNARLTPGGFEKIRLLGDYDAPNEDRTFASSQFRFESIKDDRRNFKIDLSMRYEFPVWVIAVSMYEKVPDSEIRPGMRSLR